MQKKENGDKGKKGRKRLEKRNKSKIKVENN